MYRSLLMLFGSVLVCGAVLAGPGDGAGSGAAVFEQLDTLLPTPTSTRTASGAPGPGYWQQRADYNIDVKLDEKTHRITGSAEIHYHNNSPHSISYLWLQLDQNALKPDSDRNRTRTAPSFEQLPFKSMAGLLARSRFDSDFTITGVRDDNGKKLPHTVVKTMMRVDLPRPLAPGASYRFKLGWRFTVANGLKTGLRNGYEFFKKDGNYIYEIAQWFPRMVSYTDYQGWQHKQYLGDGEFTLELGDYVVNITVPGDHVVAATGELQNPEKVMTKAQRDRLESARTSKKPVFVVTPKEAADNEKRGTEHMRTWTFKADNVRDFAWASSRKFIWDAMGVKSGDRTVMAMSFYPNEAEPLWSQYSTMAIVHTIEVYNRYTFDYPYPVSQSINGPVGGMEYPMVTFNKPRPFKDKTYWDVRQKDQDNSWGRSKYGLISVIIHEVGHNYFPMIVNSDERQWTWMDEGINTFLQFIAEQEWEQDYPSRRGEPKNITDYMNGSQGAMVPIMTNSESVLQKGNNAYGKPATALNILRESILGRELFDFAFREYARRWKFKRPTPADFFRTMEDASGVDLDWFWRGWFYSTDPVDIELGQVTQYKLDSQNPKVEKEKLRKEKEEAVKTLSMQRYQDVKKLVEKYPHLKDFYNDRDEFAVTPYDYAQYEKLLKSLDDKEEVLLNLDKLFYTVQFNNLGGLVMPLPLRITYEDKSVEEYTIPAEIWRKNARQVTKLFMADKPIVKIEFDPYLETADIDVSNNQWPRKPVETRFQLFKQTLTPNHMRRETKDGWKKKND
ncbi:MAG: M1 family metallopeptidase [Porticoccaceae bacterium]|nr:M1 family metallopeptidase [Porticoccaceae bacterium]